MNKLVHALRTWFSLTSQERLRWTQAWLLLPLVFVSLRVFGLRRVQALMDNLTAKKPKRADLLAAQALARVFHSAAQRSVLPYRCLETSLVLYWLLRHENLAADLRIGVARLDGQFAAHAWVEHGGVTLEGNGLNRQFVAFEKAFTTVQGGDL
jgi:hypothetical protein